MAVAWMAITATLPWLLRALREPSTPELDPVLTVSKA